MKFNLSAWALENRTLVLYAMIVFGILVGAWSYTQLGQSEDPPFTFKVMVIRTVWAGATAEEVSRQVTERIEKAVMETGKYNFVRSFSRPGVSQVFFMARDDLFSDDLPDLWYQLRKKVGDIHHELPREVVGPFFNDEFGDVFGNIYALTGVGFDYAVLEDYAERVQLELQRLPDVAKVELFGLQDEKIWIELSNTKLATLGLPLEAVAQAMQKQNAQLAAGFFETPNARIHLRVSGEFEDVEEIRRFPIRVGGNTFRIEDVATVRRGFADPPDPKMRVAGQDALGIGVSMAEGGDILELGEVLDARFAQLQETLPVGMHLEKVVDQPVAVRSSVGEFVKVLAEAVAVVLLVSFFSLGFRTGLVVALSIPLVLAITFAVMNWLDIGLHKISLGALVLALGLLVDDAIIAVEMMAVKMEQGFDRLKAATFAYRTTAFPMLTGTLITAAGFLPIATAQSPTGEYTRAIFEVTTLALIISWFAAVIFVPYLGARLLPQAEAQAKDEPQHDPYATTFYQRFRELVAWCVRARWLVIGITMLLFVVSVLAFRYVPQQFFPSSTRVELMVDLELTEGASLTETTQVAHRFEELIDEREGIGHYVGWIGSGSPRFYLPLDQQLPAANFAQYMLVTDSVQAREDTRRWLIDRMNDEFPQVRGRVIRLENGPPVGYPIQYRLSGEHIDLVRDYARQVAQIVRAHPDAVNVHLDWDEPSKVVRIVIDQERARALGVTSTSVAQFLEGSLSGTHVGVLRQQNQLVEIRLRGPDDERASLSLLGSLAVPTDNGQAISLSQIATLEYGFEEGVIWHRERLPTVTVRGDIYSDTLPAQVVAAQSDEITRLREQLPPGYLLEVGGTVEDSASGQKSVMMGVPLFVLVVFSLLIMQLRSFSRSLMVLLTAPLGIIGVTWFLLILNVPFGFVAMLGTIALAGMIMRNSVILVDQIEQDIADGQGQYEAIIDATVRRFRPIVLTALAAILAMIPLSRSVFFGPMAVSIMGGLFVATGLTLLFLPALYAAWFRVKVV